jgi:hypothetical protein
MKRLENTGIIDLLDVGEKIEKSGGLGEKLIYIAHTSADS